MDVLYEKIKPNRNIEIPKDVMKRLHLKVGERVVVSVRDKVVLIKPAKLTKGKPTRSIVDEITGAIEIEPRIGKRIIEDKEIEIQMFED